VNQRLVMRNGLTSVPIGREWAEQGWRKPQQWINCQSLVTPDGIYLLISNFNDNHRRCTSYNTRTPRSRTKTTPQKIVVWWLRSNIIQCARCKSASSKVSVSAQPLAHDDISHGCFAASKSSQAFKKNKNWLMNCKMSSNLLLSIQCNDCLVLV